MVVHYRTKGFIFKKENRLESDRIFTVFTYDFGRIEIFGKAIRKIASKLKGGIDIFSLSEIEFIQGKNRKTLTDAISIKKFNNITQDPEKFEIANKISEILDSFIRGQELDERIWFFIIDIFVKLNDQKTNNKFLYYYFFWNFVYILGHGPELSICVTCSQKLHPEILYFSNKEGGVICKSCFIVKKEGTEIIPDIVKILRLIVKKDWDVLSNLKIVIHSKKLLKEISDDYYNYLMHSYSFKNNLLV